MSTKITGQREIEKISPKPSEMGVASPSTKRRLGAQEGDEVVSTKIAKKHNNEPQPITPSSEDQTANENSSDFLTTSILARTLLTSSSCSTLGNSSILNSNHNNNSSTIPGGGCCYLLSDPLESLKSSLEALPAPAALDTCDGILRPTFISPSKTTIHHDTSDMEFTSLLCHEQHNRPTVTVLSPIDESNLNSLNNGAGPRSSWGQHSPTPQKATPVSLSISSLNQHQQQLNLNGHNNHHHHQNNHQVITEDENGKSYFNLGSADATIVARRTSTSSNNSSQILGDLPTSSWNNNNNICNGSSNANNNNDFDDNASSSSCESISSEDLFNSGEEFDPSDDDDDELCSYKQQRSTVLHLSLCKLNKFRTQQCVEPSLHRSVLICNTLRHIEQEIKNEDEVDESLKSREKLPSFWRSTSNHHCFSNNNPNNPNNSNNNGTGSQPQITDTRPNSNSNPLLCPNGHDPYLSPNPYANSNTSGGNGGGSLESGPPYLSYDYNSLRPTPYHTTSYDYEHDLPPQNNLNTPVNVIPPPLPSSSSISSQPLLSSEIASVATSTLLECDSGYGDDLDLTPYYYSTSPTPPLALPSQLPPQQQASTNPLENSIPIPNVSIPVLPCTSVSNTNSNSSAPTDPLISSSSSSYLSHSHCVFVPTVSPTSPPHESTETHSNKSPPNDNSNGSSNGLCDIGDAMDMEMDISNSSTNSSNGSRSPPTPPSSSCDFHLIRNHSSLSENSQSVAESNQMCWSDSNSSSSPKGLNFKDPTGSNSALTFAQQDSQCGLESRRSDLSINNHFNNHNLPMENLISSAYSSSL